MESKFMVLNYTMKNILMNLSREEVCAAAKILMQMPSPSFDIIKDSKFVTSDFHDNGYGTWVYDPAPVQATVREPVSI